MVPHLNLAGSGASIANLMLGLLKDNPGAIADVLKQQTTTRWFPSLDDEAIMTVLLPAVRRHYVSIIGGGATADEAEAAVRELTDFLNGLDAHQKRRLRNVLGTIVLTERFEKVVGQVTTNKDGARTEKADWRQVDYEYTAEDHRVIALAYMARDLNDTTIGPKGVRQQLIAVGSILETTTMQRLESAIGATGTWLTETGLPTANQALVNAMAGLINSDAYAELLDRHQNSTESERQDAMAAFIERERRVERRVDNNGIISIATSLPGKIFCAASALTIILFGIVSCSH